MKTIKKFLCISVLWVVACQSQKEVAFTESDLNVIPRPQSVVLGKGSFRFTKETVFVIDPALMPARRSFLEQFEKASGFRLSVQKVQYHIHKELSYLCIHVELKAILPYL